MPGEVTTIVGEVEEKKKSYQEKAHADKWELRVNGERVSLLKPGQPAFESGASKAEAWNIAEKVMEGEWVEVRHEGQYKNIVSLAIVARPEGAPKRQSKEEKQEYWEAKDGKIEWQAHVRNAVMLITPTLELGKTLTQGDVDRVIKAANAFREAE